MTESSYSTDDVLNNRVPRVTDETTRGMKFPAPKPNVKIITLRELGTNCWNPIRFLEGGRCPRVWTCNYPEKKGCKAITAEINYYRDKQEQYNQLAESLSKTMEKLGEFLD